ncbi:hypothetical protein RSSM_03950 [Rhodopirellula sallentina SM41]|uniref:Uncharacterized protein n=1 Tax=Rhodopirellula sallentina SM41 TaxID=1263870 RepID=M5TZW4_9BACT|nr:hypothetical protein RSSM_03950 [Rhodopirellula sallentina SM41]
MASLKGTQPNSNQERHIADYLTDEFIRVFGLAVPQYYPEEQYLISTVMFARHHLPNQMLSDRILPLVVAPTPPHFAFVLPAVYWPQRLLERWGAERPLLARMRK